MTHAAVAAVAAAGVLVGVLEQPQCNPEPARAVRVLFGRQAAGWRSLADGSEMAPTVLPKDWTIAFDGKSLGQLTTTDLDWQDTAPWTRVLSVVGDAPAVPNRKQLFGGWCGPPPDRPLVVVSRQHVADPAQWKRKDPTLEVRGRVFPPFKATAGRQVICPVDPEAAIEFNYKADDLILVAGYADKLGRRLIAVSLDPKEHYACDGPLDPAWTPNWFMLPADGGRPLFLGEGLWLVDAGDYDRDGHSELVFWFSGYNRDGYVLYADEFLTRVDYLWNYH